MSGMKISDFFFKLKNYYHNTKMKAHLLFYQSLHNIYLDLQLVWQLDLEEILADTVLAMLNLALKLQSLSSLQCDHVSVFAKRNKFNLKLRKGKITDKNYKSQLKSNY